MLIILILAIMPLTCLCQLRPPDRGEVLTLEEAITLAIRGNPAIKKAELDIEISSDRLAAAATRRLPSFEVNLLESQTLTRLDFRFPRGIFGTYPSTGPVPNEDTTIGTSRQPTTFLYARAAQPISQLHRINLGLKLEEIRRESAREKLRSEKQSVTRDVKRIYYDLIGLQSALENVEENIRLYRELDRVVGEQVAQKVALKADSLEVKTQIAAQEYSSLTLRNSLASQKEQFNLLLGRDVETDFRVSALTDGTMIEVDLAAARAQALDQRPEIREARLMLKQADLDQRIKKSELIPDISLAVTYLRIAPISIIPQNIASVGISLTWEPFDWGRRKRERDGKIKTAEQAQIAVRTTEAQVRIEINSLYRKLEEARAMLKVSQLAQDSTREKLRVTTNLYANQSAMLKDLLQAQSAMTETGHKYQQSLLAYWKTRAEFERATGKD